MTIPTGETKRHLLTVNLEDYYQVGAFNALIQRGQWYRFESRLEKSTLSTLELLDEFGIRATFFVLGWVGQILPELVRTVADRGHEIGSRGFYHRGVRALTPSEFREDLIHAREVLERASRRRILGYRVADGWFEPQDLWALDVLASEGYEYDSSIAPVLRRYSSEPWRRFIHPHHFGDKVLWEFPISSTQVLGNLLPVTGGNYMRQLPTGFVRRATARWHREYTAPMVFYLHTWELDPDQPKISAASWLARVRQYRNLDRMEERLRYYFSRYPMSGIAEHLGLSTMSGHLTERRSNPTFKVPAFVSPPSPAIPAADARTPVTVVIPCFNEELILPYLSNTLASVQAKLGGQYAFQFVFVDDRSSDDTFASLHRMFGDWPDCTIIRHERNRGVAAAIMTGITAANTEIVCSIDCDCTYDPHELGGMIPLLQDADLVTASPYHPQGRVHNVPAWRLLLSRGLSAMYRGLLRKPIHTWTSCFRVHRKSAAVTLQLTRGGFLGVAETMAMLALRGARIREYPATLEVRILGRSKMKVLHTIAGHLKLLGRLARLRITGNTGPRLATVPAERPRSTVAPANVLHRGS